MGSLGEYGCFSLGEVETFYCKLPETMYVKQWKYRRRLLVELSQKLTYSTHSTTGSRHWTRAAVCSFKWRGDASNSRSSRHWLTGSMVWRRRVKHLHLVFCSIQLSDVRCPLFTVNACKFDKLLPYRWTITAVLAIFVHFSNDDVVFTYNRQTLALSKLCPNDHWGITSQPAAFICICILDWFASVTRDADAGLLANIIGIRTSSVCSWTIVNYICEFGVSNTDKCMRSVSALSGSRVDGAECWLSLNFVTALIN